MNMHKSTIPFRDTPEQQAKLEAAILEHKDQPGALMPVMQQAQEIYGYLPIEVQAMIAEGLGCSLEQVYGVSPFMPGSTWNPRGSTLSGSVWVPPAMSRGRRMCWMNWPAS